MAVEKENKKMDNSIESGDEVKKTVKKTTKKKVVKKPVEEKSENESKEDENLWDDFKDKPKEEKKDLKEDSEKPVEVKEVEEKKDEKVSEERSVSERNSDSGSDGKSDSDEKPEEKKPEKKVAKKDVAVAKGVSLHVSKKQCMYICSFVKNKNIDSAMRDLEDVIKLKKAVPFKGEIPHRKGKMMSGRYPVKAAKIFVTMLKGLKGNVIQNGLDFDKTRITLASASWASRPMRSGSRQGKRTNVILEAREIVSEKPKAKKKVSEKQEKKE